MMEQSSPGKARDILVACCKRKEGKGIWSIARELIRPYSALFKNVDLCRLHSICALQITEFEQSLTADNLMPTVDARPDQTIKEDVTVSPSWVMTELGPLVAKVMSP